MTKITSWDVRGEKTVTDLLEGETEAPIPGAVKYDSGKIPVSRGVTQYFPRALTLVGAVSVMGAKKYDWEGFRYVESGQQRYQDAALRHELKEKIEGELDGESGLLHKAHKAWDVLAELELYLMEHPEHLDGLL